VSIEKLFQSRIRGRVDPSVGQIERAETSPQGERAICAPRLALAGRRVKVGALVAASKPESLT